ncbi:MAG: prenylated flavin chaperone LpdD [Candidatus Hodarchaeales archaeon]
MISLRHIPLQLQTSPFTIDFCFTLLDRDILIIISGPNPHAGAVSLADPYEKILQDNSSFISASTSSLSKYRHKDSDFTSILSKGIAKEFNRTTVVVGGIHIDNISKETIKEILALPKLLIEKIKKLI